MTSDQMKYFLVVEKCLNFSEAAEELNISQPSLTRHIKNLENEIGVPLFNRSTRKTMLTPAGVLFHNFAEQFMGDYNKLFMDIKEFSPRRKRKITLSSVPVMSMYRITEMIAAFCEEKPDITFDIIEEDTLYVVQSLLNFKADIGFTNVNNLLTNGIKVFPILEDEFVFIVNKNHRFADRKIISLAETADENFLFLGNETTVYSTCLQECRKAGFEPQVINAPNTNMRIGTIIDFVSKGIGVSIIMAKAAECHLNSNFRIIPMKEKIRSSLAFVVRNEPIPSACKMLIDYGIKYYEKT